MVVPAHGTLLYSGDVCLHHAAHVDHTLHAAAHCLAHAGIPKMSEGLKCITSSRSNSHWSVLQGCKVTDFVGEFGEFSFSPFFSW